MTAPSDRHPSRVVDSRDGQRPRSRLRIGCWAGAWGDTLHGAADLVEHGDVDFLVADYLAEVTMALLARARSRDADAGYVGEAIDVLAPLLTTIKRRRIRVVTNAGGLNPRALRDHLLAAARNAGVDFRVAIVEGDDLLPVLDCAAIQSMDPRHDVPPHPVTANAYLGARPIATALDLGAEVVITGRCVDSALVLGPLMHRFGWTDHAYDQLSAGTLLGHLVECGAQGTGGQHTDWSAVPDWHDVGMPIIDVGADGVGVITKVAGSGGLVTPPTVAEQMLYEIGDPGAYLMPDVTCDWRAVRLIDDGPSRVRVEGAIGHPPTSSFKATATTAAGFRTVGLAMYVGHGAAARARRVGDAVIARVNRILALSGQSALERTSIEVVGSGDFDGRRKSADVATEVILKLAARDDRREALEVLSRELIPAALSMGQGMAAGPGGRPRVSPVYAVTSLLVDKAAVKVSIEFDGRRIVVPIDRGGSDVCIATAQLAALPIPSVETELVPLRRLAFARSGDKGNNANIGVIARRPELLPVIAAHLTPARVAHLFGHVIEGDVSSWELPGVSAVNFLLTDVLGGQGGTTSLRFDAQGKTFASVLLDTEIPVPKSLLPLVAESAPPEVRDPRDATRPTSDPHRVAAISPGDTFIDTSRYDEKRATHAAQEKP